MRAVRYCVGRKVVYTTDSVRYCNLDTNSVVAKGPSHHSCAVGPDWNRCSSSAQRHRPSKKVVSVASLLPSSAGLRLGWAITRGPELRQQLVTAKFTMICCSPIDETLKFKVFERRDWIVPERRVRPVGGAAADGGLGPRQPQPRGLGSNRTRAHFVACG